MPQSDPCETIVDCEKGETIVDCEKDQTIVDCEKEKIHSPGRIQPLGILIAADDTSPASGILNISANCGELGLDAQAVIGNPLATIFEGRLARMLATRAGGVGDHPALLGVAEFSSGDTARPCTVLAHRRQSKLILELEYVVPPRRPAFEYLHELSEEFSVRLRNEKTVEGAAELAAEEVRRVLGFDRSLVYRFGPEWHGTVIAENGNGRLPSYLNFRFPASDVPGQARELYRLNRVRCLADIEQQPVPIVGPLADELDLTYACLRSISPVHAQYMRNMNTRASASISILVGGQLWGLIASHNRDPQRVSFKQRLVCDLIGCMLSERIALAMQWETERKRSTRKTGPARLLGWMGTGIDLADAFRKHSSDLLDLTEATGAALVVAGRCSRFGRTPPEKQILRLADALHQNGYPAQTGMYTTDRVSSLLPEFADHAQTACGIIAISLSDSAQDCLIWFRPEVAYTVRWAGEPTKLMQTIDGVTQYHPRLSFEEWLEQVINQSEPWHPVHLETAGTLRQGVLSVIDRKALENQLLQAQRLESIGQLAAGVAHEINTPIQFIGDNNAFLSKTFASLIRLLETYRIALASSGAPVPASVEQAEKEADIAYLREEIPLALSQSKDGIQRVTEIVRAMKDLSHPSSSSKQPADLHALIDSAIALSRNEWKLVASVSKDFAPGLPFVPCLAGPISQAILNLIVNASHAIADAKRSADAETDAGEIHIQTRATSGHVEIRIRDNGPGIPKAVQEKIFLPFFTTKAVGKGTGQGLALAWTTIVKRHGGALEFETEEGVGTTFVIRLPLADPTEKAA